MAALNNAVHGALRLQGRVAVITGGASGIGKETVTTFVAHGAKVIIADIQDGPGEKLAEEVGGPDVARYIHCDVSQEEQVAAAVDLSVSAFGGLDIMYNNAGVLGPLGSIDEISVESFDKLYGVLLKGTFLGIKHAARVMKPQLKGSIISTTSAAAHIAGSGPHAYTTFKHGVVGLTRSAAYELRDFQIRVNSISPGGVITPMSGALSLELREKILSQATNKGVSSTLTTPNNIATTALFLASDDSAHVSGHSLVVDGSQALHPARDYSATFFASQKNSV